MPGESWQQLYQIGKEVTEGTAVAATRKLYGTGDLTRTRDVQLIKVSSGTRDNQRDVKLRSVQAGGTFTQPLSNDEIIELLLGTIQTSPGIVTALGASTWTFKPTLASPPDPQTWEWFDGYRNWQQRGVRIDQLKISGTVGGDTTVAATLFGREMITAAQTAALADRVPNFIEGWETKLYIDAFGATPGTTNVPGTMLAWDVTINNHLGRKYYADNTTATGGVVLGALDIAADITLEANASALTEYTNRDTPTKRLVRLEFGNNGAVLGTSALKPLVSIDIPGAWTAIDLTPEDNGTKVYKFSYQYIYDVTNAFAVQFKVQTTRTTGY
jgi:hypothetical protein